MTEQNKSRLKYISEETLLPISVVFAALSVCFYMAVSYAENKTAVNADVKALTTNDVRQDAAIEAQRKEMMDYVKNQTVLFTEIRDRLTRLEADKRSK